MSVFFERGAVSEDILFFSSLYTYPILAGKAEKGSSLLEVDMLHIVNGVTEEMRAELAEFLHRIRDKKLEAGKTATFRLGLRSRRLKVLESCGNHMRRGLRRIHNGCGALYYSLK